MPRLTTQCGCVCERESLEIHLFSNEGSELKNEGSLQWMHYGCRRCMSVQCRQRRKCHQLRETERQFLEWQGTHTHAQFCKVSGSVRQKQKLRRSTVRPGAKYVPLFTVFSLVTTRKWQTLVIGGPPVTEELLS